MGGAYKIEARDASYIEVQYTSTPVASNTGIRITTLYDNSSMLFLDGAVDQLNVRDDSTATLKGGTINSIRIYHLSSWLSEVVIYCQAGYTMDSTGISGLWADGTSFDIDFIDVGGAFSAYPTYDYVEVVVIPEPTTISLLGIGSLLIRRKK